MQQSVQSQVERHRTDGTTPTNAPASGTAQSQSTGGAFSLVRPLTRRQADLSQGGLKQTLAAHDPRTSAHTRKLQLVLTATRGVIGSVGSLASADQRYARALVDCSGEHQEGIVKGPAADELTDMLDRIASIEYLTAEALNDYSTALEQARTGFKDIRSYEAKLNESVSAASRLV